MITQDEARAALKEKLAKNLVILSEFENTYQWCFGLGFVNDNDEIVPLIGDSIIRIDKETGEMDQ
ncbi:hypothetical protein [Butyrivibrio sp. AC2005]|uniref:hypothetical protein n=1 Tax=Butyrivibrio sp. AC2005 TaxID=1280672 RepID=UPI00040C2CBC|nr:hypothetical protein [Butyrivibrio sp. AC2005]